MMMMKKMKKKKMMMMMMMMMCSSSKPVTESCWYPKNGSWRISISRPAPKVRCKYDKSFLFIIFFVGGRGGEGFVGCLSVFVFAGRDTGRYGKISRILGRGEGCDAI